MAFTVNFSNEKTTNYPENIKFKIEPNGVLTVTGGGSRVHFAPHAWVSVEDEALESKRSGGSRGVVMG